VALSLSQAKKPGPPTVPIFHPLQNRQQYLRLWENFL
jgi:hypothetical protein